MDTAPITQRSNASVALRNSVGLAQLVDDLGYHRYWVPEHHGMSGVDLRRFLAHLPHCDSCDPPEKFAGTPTRRGGRR
ncbi:LLM class flavin-dependent oxidoreductase [Nocardia abscessus]|nr:LLM class flavin-dependent oxidoreductase [Nocardia abscessus]